MLNMDLLFAGSSQTSQDSGIMMHDLFHTIKNNTGVPHKSLWLLLTISYYYCKLIPVPYTKTNLMYNKQGADVSLYT